MQKTTLIQASIIAPTGAVAISLGAQLAHHNVGTTALVAVLTCVTATGLNLARQISEGFRTTLYTCPANDCPVSIRAAGTSKTELERLHALATDHSKHGTDR
ncbi:hypothetical protein [Streptomyces sp. NPDC005407]|uniref:hypothetical protein n=1 Tax=Streptomyces sp. NPDC005407 TaxID=3155340 RepID=UPI0033AAA17F